MNALRKRICTGTAIAAVASLMLAATPAWATIANEGIFQIDDPSADVCGGGAITGPPAPTACVDNPTVADDWDTLITCAAAGGVQGDCSVNVPFGNAAEKPSFIYDNGGAAGANSSIFTGGGTKDGSDIPSWLYKDGSVPDKDNIVEAFAAVYRPTSGARTNHKILYFGANRLAVDGDAQIGFWFLQNNVTLGGPAGGGGNHFIGTHKVGDILILSDFVKGGGQSTIQVFVIQSIAANGDITFSQPFGANTTSSNFICAGDPTDPGLTCAATNGQASSALDPNFQPKGFTTGLYDVVGFFEGGIDLTSAERATGITGLASECFGSFLVETRSSQSITAVLKDFALGPFEGCTATTSTQIHWDQNPAGAHVDVQNGTIPRASTIHDKIIVTGSLGKPAPTGTVEFRFYSGVDNCTGTYSVLATDALGLHDGQAQNPPISTAESVSTGALSAGKYSFLAVYSGDSNYVGVIPNVNDTADVAAHCEKVTVSSPSIDISKSCSAAISTDGTSVTITISGTVTNDGDEVLSGFVITDDPAATIPTVPPATLAPGGSFGYTGSYSTTTGATSYGDTVTVHANNANSVDVFDTATTTCPLVIAPNMTVSKTCSNVLVATASNHLEVKVNVSGKVTNTGNTQLTISSFSDNVSPGVGATHSGCEVGTVLSPGAFCDYTGSYFPSSLSGTNGLADDTVSVQATSTLNGSAQSKSTTATCNLCPLP